MVTDAGRLPILRGGGDLASSAYRISQPGPTPGLIPTDKAIPGIELLGKGGPTCIPGRLAPANTCPSLFADRQPRSGPPRTTPRMKSSLTGQLLRTTATLLPGRCGPPPVHGHAWPGSAMSRGRPWRPTPVQRWSPASLAPKSLRYQPIHIHRPATGSGHLRTAPRMKPSLALHSISPRQPDPWLGGARSCRDH